MRSTSKSTADPELVVRPSVAATKSAAPGAFVATGLPSTQIESLTTSVVLLQAGSTPIGRPAGAGAFPGEALLPTGCPPKSRLSTRRGRGLGARWNVLAKTVAPAGTAKPSTW